MKISYLFTLPVFLFLSCSSAPNTAFIVDDYLSNIELLDKDNKFYIEKIEALLTTNISSNKESKENFNRTCSLFNSIFAKVEVLSNPKKKEITATNLTKLYSSCLEEVIKVEKIIKKQKIEEEIQYNSISIFEHLKNEPFWRNLIQESKNYLIEVSFVKLYYELKIAENKVYKFYENEINYKRIICPGLGATIIAPSSYIMGGLYYEAEIHLTPFNYANLDKIIKIIVNGKEVPMENGHGVYKAKAPDYAGIHIIEGYIEIAEKEEIVKVPFISEWQSFIPAFLFEFDRVQKIKKNEEIEFTVLAPGFRQEAIIIESSKGKISKGMGMGKYKILVNEPPNTEFQILVSVEMPDGSKRKLGTRTMVVQ
jgi:hypothetical protein